MEMVIGVIVSILVGIVGGGILVFLGLWLRRSKLDARAEELEGKSSQIAEQQQKIDQERKQLEEWGRAQHTEHAHQHKLQGEQLAQLQQRAAKLEQREREFTAKQVSYEELRKENEICKRDLFNVEMSVRKGRVDIEQTRKRQEELDARSRELASRYLKENVKFIMNSVSARNYAALKQRLVDVVGRCRDIGFEIAPAEEAQLLSDLKVEFEKAVRAELEREEQARIRAQIREEQKVQREIDREIQQAEREKAAVQAALDRALAAAKDSHSIEVEHLRAKLAEAEARSQRAMSRAQMTRAGNVYVISNVGAFGEGVFKVGMTRRLEPEERISELSSASVPFPFDIHMMISSDDAPTLETALHRALSKSRMNRVNPRKEFFKTDRETILKIVEENHGKVEYFADAEALEYRQSQTMSDEDAAYIEEVFDNEDEEAEPIPDGQ